MAKRKVRVNKFSQYKKESDRLVLDTYSAGCGGIVLRWRDPKAGTPVMFAIGCDFDVKVFLDGRPVGRAAFLKPGEHVLAFQCAEIERTNHRLIVMQMMFNYADSSRDPIEGFNSNTSWVCKMITGATEMQHEIASQWTTPSYDDSGWLRMGEGNSPSRDSSGSWMYRHVIDMGGQLLAMPDAKDVLIRYRFNWERDQ